MSTDKDSPKQQRFDRGSWGFPSTAKPDDYPTGEGAPSVLPTTGVTPGDLEHRGHKE